MSHNLDWLDDLAEKICKSCHAGKIEEHEIIELQKTDRGFEIIVTGYMCPCGRLEVY